MERKSEFSSQHPSLSSPPPPLHQFPVSADFEDPFRFVELNYVPGGPNTDPIEVNIYQVHFVKALLNLSF